MVIFEKMFYNKETTKERMIPMLKKLVSLFLSLLICLSLMPGQAYADDLTVPSEMTGQVEFSDAGFLNESENPIMPLDYPANENDGHET